MLHVKNISTKLVGKKSQNMWDIMLNPLSQTWLILGASYCDAGRNETLEILETMFRLGLYILRMLKELEIANHFRCEAKYDC